MTIPPRVSPLLAVGVALGLASLAACNSGIQVGQETGGTTSVGTTSGGTTTGGRTTGGASTSSGTTTGPVGRAVITAPGALSPSPCEVDIDFGDIPVGSTASQSIKVTNTGNDVLDLSPVNAMLDPAFELTYSAPPQLQPGDSYQFGVSFNPSASGPVTSAFSILDDGVNPACREGPGTTASDLTVQLTGTGVEPSLAVDPNVLDFGNTLINTTLKKSVMLINTGTTAVTNLVATVNGGDANLFVVGDLPAMLAGGADAGVDISYTPVALETRSLASVLFSGSGGQKTTLSLFGEPLGSALTLDPNPVNCGFVPLGATAICCTAVTNQSNISVNVTAVEDFANAGGAFALSPIDDSTPPNPVALPVSIGAGESAEVCFSLTPTVSQQYTGQATLDTDDPSGTNPLVQLTGWGGGPQIVCVPVQSLTFGPVFVGSSSTMSVTCTNTGTALPGVALTIGPLSAEPSVFSAAFDTTTNPYPDGGLDPGNSAQVDATYTPLEAANDIGELVIQNNGGKGQTLHISLTGSGQ